MGLLTRPIIALRRWGASDTAGRIRSFLPRPLRSLLHRVRKSLACIPLRIVLPVLPRQTAPVRVVIFGTFAGNWLDRLADPQAWRACPAVREVVLWPDDPARPFPEPLPGDIRTVVIPLSEDNVIGRPLSLAGLAPDGRAVAILRNKASFAAYVRAEGLDHLCPVTYATRGQVAFPCIVKYVNAAFAFGSRILRSDCELDDLLRGEPWDGGTFIVQQVVQGALEYSTQCVCRAGRPLWSTTFAFENEEGQPIRRGVTFGP